MQILIADGNHNDADRLYNIIPFALPGAKCYVCSNPSYLKDFLYNFRLDYIFVGSFADLMTLEEVLIIVRKYNEQIPLIHYCSSLSKEQIYELRELGCYAVIGKSDSIQNEVNGLKTLFSSLSRTS